jgi:hypothetical protein
VSDDASNRVIGSMAAAIWLTIDWIAPSVGASGERTCATASRSCDDGDQTIA